MRRLEKRAGIEQEKDFGELKPTQTHEKGRISAASLGGGGGGSGIHRSWGCGGGRGKQKENTKHPTEKGEGSGICSEKRDLLEKKDFQRRITKTPAKFTGTRKKTLPDRQTLRHVLGGWRDNFECALKFSSRAGGTTGWGKTACGQHPTIKGGAVGYQRENSRRKGGAVDRRG